MKNYFSTLVFFSKNENFKTTIIKDWDMKNQIPNEGDYVEVQGRIGKVERVIWDFDDFKITFVVA